MNPIHAVNKESLYQFVAEIEGIKHPVISPQALNAAGDQIVGIMEDYGFHVREQIFKIDGWDAPFRNIEGSIGPVEEKPAAVLMAHYDTVATTPGANDNGAGCAVILEAGRVLALLDDPPPVYVVAVSLEENNNPMIWLPERESAFAHGIQDEKFQYPSWTVAKTHKTIWDIAYREYFSGKSYGEGLQIGLKELGDLVPDNVKAHIEEIIPLYLGLDVLGSMGVMNRIGSGRWVEEAVASGKNIAFNITVDEPGIFREEPFSQGLLAGMGFEIFNRQYGLDAEQRVGDFIMLATHIASSPLGAVYAEQCEREEIDLPYGWADVPLTFEQIVQNLPLGLNSDHAHFWRHKIPALFVFDSSNARDPYVHTMADTIDKLNFDRLAQVTQALVATLLDERAYRS